MKENMLSHVSSPIKYVLKRTVPTFTCIYLWCHIFYLVVVIKDIFSPLYITFRVPDLEKNQNRIVVFNSASNLKKNKDMPNAKIEVKTSIYIHILLYVYIYIIYIIRN